MESLIVLNSYFGELLFLQVRGNRMSEFHRVRVSRIRARDIR